MTTSLRPLLLVLALLPAWAQADPLTLPQDRRPEWVARDGVVMAGSWEPLMFRVRRDGGPGYEPTAQQRADYEREHSPEMIQKLKGLGVNFVMMHCHKGGGLKAEQESMADAVRFARLCHDAGLRVGVYNYSGAFMWELLFQERPDAKDWVVRDRDGKPATYGGATYRYYWNRNHPDAQAYYRRLVRFAVEEIQADLIHFDNYVVGPGWDNNSVERFRRYLGQTFSPERLKSMGIADLSAAGPPAAKTKGLLRFAWDDFQCQSIADSYWDMCRYARSLRPDVLLECNPDGVGARIQPPVDHGRLLPGGEAFWDEGDLPGLKGKELTTRIRTYKVARRMDNLAFTYTRTPLEMAEAMAFNLDCLGCVCWFEYAGMTNYPGSWGKPIVPETAPYIRFFHERRDLLRGARVVADVAVLRSFPSQVFAPPEHAALSCRVEKALIESRGCFQIIFDHQTADLERYPVLVLAGCVALSDEQIQRIGRYAAAGGRLCVIGPVATHDAWMNPRKMPGLGSLPEGSVVEVPATADVLDAIGRACGQRQSLKIAAKSASGDGKRGDSPFVQSTLRTVPGNGESPLFPLLGLCAELTEQPNRRLVHLVNYREKDPIGELEIAVRLPAQRKVSEVRLANPERSGDLKASFRQEGDVVRFTVPTVGVYEIAVITLR